MTMRWFGALLVIAGCGGVGFLMAAAYKKEETALQDVIGGLQYMLCELQYRVSPLPQLCSVAAERSGGCVGEIFRQLHRELESQMSPDASACMLAAISKVQSLPEKGKMYMLQLGKILGCFDLPGQIKGIEAVEKRAMLDLEMLRKDRDVRCRNYRIFGFCAGLALVVLFI